MGSQFSRGAFTAALGSALAGLGAIAVPGAAAAQGDAQVSHSAKEKRRRS